VIPFSDLVRINSYILGQGSYGKVYAARWKNQVVAVKHLEFAEKDEEKVRQRFMREVYLLSQSACPYVVPFYGFCLEPLCLVMKQMKQSVAFHIEDVRKCEQNKIPSQRRHSLREIIENGIRVSSGLAELHNEKRIAHRDVTSCNILLDNEGKAYIADFGMARDKLNATARTEYSEMYRPPESYANSTGIQADLYQFGLLLWEMLKYEKVYENLHGKVSEQIRHIRPSLDGIPPLLHPMFTKCWKELPHERGTMTEVVDALKDFLNGLPPQNPDQNPNQND